ncbi:MAG: hypothetical protein KAR47_11780, partial [Planctomycetes bacterium]|nr:hypothetical protein [Planctomycetota bacterium]
MNQTNEKTKITSLLAAIVRWIFIAILSILLVAGLAFRAPWKVLALVAILLAVATIVPKPARKYIWLAFAAVVIAIIIWAFVPETDTGEWKPYTFDKELATLEAKRAIPDSENAATIYYELLEHYDGERYAWPDLGGVDPEELHDPNFSKLVKLFKPTQPKNTFYPEFWSDKLAELSMSGPWSSRDYPELVKWLNEKHNNTITQFMSAAEKKACSFPLKLNALEIANMDFLHAIRDWVKLIVRSANNDYGDGRIAEAAKKYIAVLRTIRLIGDHPDSLSIPLQFGLAHSTKSLCGFLITADLTDNQLTGIEEAITNAKYDWCSNWHKIVECEKLKFKGYYAIAYETGPKGKIRLSRGTAFEDQLRAKYNIASPPSYGKEVGKRIATILIWFWFPHSPEKVSQIVDEVFEKYYAMAEPDYDWQQEPPKSTWYSVSLNCEFFIEMGAAMSTRSYHRLYDISRQYNDYIDGYALIVSLRRYKSEFSSWPENLAQMQDVHS